MRLTTPVRPEWIDYNGHLSEAYYVLVFGWATDEVMARIGLDEAYRERTGCSLYTVEAHIRYLQEVGAGVDLEVTSTIVGSGAKKLRICHEMAVAGDLVATEEILGLHVDARTERTLPFPEPVVATIEELIQAPPEYAGRSITA